MTLSHFSIKNTANIYSGVLNTRGGSNNRGGGIFCQQLINRETNIGSNKRGGWNFFQELINREADIVPNKWGS